LVPEGGVPSGGVVEAFDEVEDCGAGILAGLVGVAVEEFCFQGGEERFGYGVVVCVSLPAHGRDDPGLPAAVPERDGGVLGRFNRSLQHLEMEVFDGQASWMDEGVDGSVADEVAGGAVGSEGDREGVLV